MTQIVSYSTSTFHQLNLLFINTHDSTITISITIKPDNKTVTQTCNLMIISNTSHWTTGRNNISEMIKKFKNLLSRHWILVLVFYTGDFIRYTPMHIHGTLLVDSTEAIFHRILVHPYSSSEFVATKILQGSLKCILKREGLIVFHYL